MQKAVAVFIIFSLLCTGVRAQDKTDDSTAYYDELFAELDNFLDSVTAPRTMMLLNLGVTNVFLNYETQSSFDVTTTRRISYSPSFGYFHKKGFGINITSQIVNDGQHLNPYQFMLTGSYDYLKSTSFISGINITRFFTKDSLPFYTSPLLNEVSAYFTYRKWWFKPSVIAAYGWGSRKEYEEREAYITSLRLRPNGYTRINTEETVSDLSLTFSLRHDFYKLAPLGEKSYFRFTPQLSFTSGTQKFGFNQSSNTYGTRRTSNRSELYSSESNYLDDELYFQPISVGAFLKTELSYGKCYVQPQLAASYYFPATDKHFSSAFIVNAGVIF
jgi:hypothetical protein